MHIVQLQAAPKSRGAGVSVALGHSDWSGADRHMVAVTPSPERFVAALLGMLEAQVVVQVELADY